MKATRATWALPDLIVIDGGKGQLGMALAAARDVGIDVRPGVGLPIVGLAKERDVAVPDEDEDAEADGETPSAAAEPPRNAVSAKRRRRAGRAEARGRGRP